MKRLLIAMMLLVTQVVGQVVLFTEDFETPVVPTGYAEGTTPSAWVRASVGFNSNRHGINRIGDGQVYTFRYTNSGITTDDGEIGTIDLNFATYEVSFDVMQDRTSAEIPYVVNLFAAPLGIPKNDCSGGFLTPAGSIELTRTSGNAPSDGSTNRVTMTYQTNPYMTNLDGYDLGIRIFGATTSANIDNVRVTYSPFRRKFVMVGNKLLRVSTDAMAVLPLWTPEHVQKLAWYDAADLNTITEVAGAVSQWDDKSGNERNLTQGSGSLQPITDLKTIGGLNVIDFNAQPYMDTPAFFDPESGFHIFSVMQAQTFNQSANNVLIQNISNGAGGTGRSIFYNVGTVNPDTWQTFLGASPAVVLGNSSLNVQNFSLSVTASASSNDIESWFHGAAGSGGTKDIEANPNSQLRIGATSSGTLDWDGTVGEVIIVPDVASTDTRQRIEGYLAWKWGLTDDLPSDHPYKNEPPYYIPWTPADVDTFAWYDAADTSTITESGGFVSQWDDKSSYANHVAQLTGVRQPSTGVEEINHRNVLSFDDDDGQEQLFKNPLNSFGSPQSLDLYFVARVDDLSDTSQSIVQYNGSATSAYLDNLQAIIGFRVRNDTGQQRIRTLTADSDTHIQNVRYNGSVAEFYVDGTDESPGVNTLTGNVTLNRLYMSANFFGGQGMPDGVIAEVILVPYQTESERQKIEGYLAWKWGLVGSLPSDHPYKYSKPMK